MPSFSNFWKMVWKYNVVNIIMLCGINEEGRLKCDIYFPDNDLSTTQMRIGNDFELTLLNIDKTNTFYWIRKFNLKNLKEGGEREVLQYHVSAKLLI